MSHKYRDYKPEQLEELFSNFLFDRWSYSKVASFSRNEKAFEMQYIYCEPMKSSAVSFAGRAYHQALKSFFTEFMNGTQPDIVTLQEIAYSYFETVMPFEWKLQKTTPTVDDCVQSATKTVNALLDNFMQEKSVYISEIAEILMIEEVIEEFVTINGVDIPLPLKGILDLVFKNKEGKVIIVDHKSKSSFTDEKELKFSGSKQAISYYNLFLEHTGIKADEVWFVENKYSKNRDGSSQLQVTKIAMDDDTIRLYEALLYEPLKRMLEAISNPDYVYLINSNDNFVDQAELYEFWARTMIAEIDDFNVPENKKEMVSKRLRKIRNSSLSMISPDVIKSFKKNAREFIPFDLTNSDMTNEQKIEHVCRTFGMIIKVEHTFEGYSSNTYLISVSSGTTISSLSKYKLDIASVLNVPSVRIQKELFVFQDRAYVAVEATKKRDKFLYFDKKYQTGSKIPLGIDNFGNLITWDLDNPSTPHVLIGGATGSGKSVMIVSIIEYAKILGIESIFIFDPKHEFTSYHNGNISVYNDIQDIETTMELLVEEMNLRVASGQNDKTMIVFDEFADAVANSRKGKELNIYENVTVGTFQNGNAKVQRQLVGVKKSLEENLRILLQKGRSSGFRIVAATQRASVKVITGDAKVNLPVQICFQVPKEIDSKVILDESGAESLAGKGDGLIKSPEINGVVRFQSFFKQI